MRASTARLDAGPDGTDAHALTDLSEGLGSHLPSPLGTLCKCLLKGVFVVAKLVVALARGPQVLHDGVRHGLLERAVLLALELALDRRHVDAADHAQDLDQVRDARLVRRHAHLAARVRDRALDLL